ncbi:hypothetical protein OC846_002022 [Tilletia horrida]|uniref:Uncharacterized protein n=1 Tax=Tilletia horrida TaxID=155126 RepID=A0AAN6JZD1_9BASI|nr:hypothetical protein OC845_002161 [Tilletia horrida]KAK0554688.1 hypothetical protein OC846_002022 [Tilletia horrida]KAK0569808.1 hypothetical protein OC861_000519 [Tilletia horrida]
MSSPYYLGESGGPTRGASGGAAVGAGSNAPRAYVYDEEDEQDQTISGAGGGAASSLLQSYQSQTASSQQGASQYARQFGPQSGGGGGGVRLPSGNVNPFSSSSSAAGPSAPSSSQHNPVLFDSADGSTQSPLLHSSYAGGAGVAGGPPGASVGAPSRRNIDDAHASYSTSFTWSLSSACAIAYAFPPITSVAVLILETQNDLARFHAYQAGVLGVIAWMTMWFLRSILGWYSLSVIVGMGLLGWFWVCASNAANAAPTLARVPYLPNIGPLAEQWVGEE